MSAVSSVVGIELNPQLAQNQTRSVTRMLLQLQITMQLSRELAIIQATRQSKILYKTPEPEDRKECWQVDCPLGQFAQQTRLSSHHVN
jgi:hypothetical protein